MADVDSEIVATYLETEGYFVRLSSRYNPNQALADIDILAIHPITGDKIWGEVKGWVESKEKFQRSWEAYIENTFDKDAKEKYVRQVLGDKFRKVFYLPLGRVSEEFKTNLRSKAIEIFDLAEVAKSLKEKSKNGRLSITDKALRLLKILEMTE